MQLIPTVTFHGLEPSPALDADVRRRIAKLERYYRAITGCRVRISFVQRHHQTGNRFRVRIALTVPGEELVVANQPSLHANARAVEQRVKKGAEVDPGRKDAHVAVHEAFDVARRRLQDFARRQRGFGRRRAGP